MTCLPHMHVRPAPAGLDGSMGWMASWAGADHMGHVHASTAQYWHCTVQACCVTDLWGSRVCRWPRYHAFPCEGAAQPVSAWVWANEECRCGHVGNYKRVPTKQYLQRSRYKRVSSKITKRDSCMSTPAKQPMQQAFQLPTPATHTSQLQRRRIRYLCPPTMPHHDGNVGDSEPHMTHSVSWWALLQQGNSAQRTYLV